MRFKFLAVLSLVCGLAAPQAGQAQAVAVHQAAPAAALAAPAKPSAIIPGSPLAALTGAGQPPPAASTDANTPAPFGAGNLGLAITGEIGAEIGGSVHDFVSAVEKSTRLTPLIAWFHTLGGDPDRRAEASGIARGLLLTVLPAIAADFLVRFALARPRAAFVARASARLARHAVPVNSAPSTEDGLAGAEAGETEKPPPLHHRRASFRAWMLRFGLALVHLLLALLPVGAFVLVAGTLLGTGLITMRQSRLSIIGVSNAYLFGRLSLEFLRLLVAPQAPALRLVRCSTLSAGRLVAGVRVLLLTGGIGYALILTGEVLGLAHAGSRVLVALLGLALHIEVAVMVWQWRHVVARWIAGRKDADSYIAGARHRFARIWHFLALFYILALWVALAAGVQNAFGVLLRAVLVFIAALTLGRAAWVGSAQLLERLFPDAGAATLKHPTFFARARAYNPLARVLIRLVIGVAVIILLLLGWGVDVLPWLLKDKFTRSLFFAFVSIIVTVVISLLLWESVNAILDSRIDALAAAGHTRQASRLRTLLPMLRASIGIAISLVAGLICLSRIGVNAAPLLAGAGVLGIAIGFGSQKLVQDIITGLFLLLEDAIQVGDVVSLASMSGTVERLSIRTIRLRGGDGSINIIPFSAVTTVTNMTRDFGYAQISIQVGYEEDLPHVYAVLDDIARTMRAEPAWGAMMRDNLQIFGLDQFGASALVITGQIRTGPGQHWAVRREFYARVKQRFEAEGIDMPYAYLAPAPRPELDKPQQESSFCEQKEPKKL